MSQCGSGNTMTGGRRSMKARRRGRKTMRGGAVLPSFGGTIGTAGAIMDGAGLAAPYSSSTGQAIPDPYSSQSGGVRRRSKNMYRAQMISAKKTKGGAMSVKTMKRMLKKNGLKVSGKKSTLTKRMKKAHIMKGGASSYLPGGASAGFVGTGERGLANVVDVGTPIPNGVQSA